MGSDEKTKSRVPLGWLARLWLLGIGLLLAVDWLSGAFRLSWLTRIYFWGTLLMSLICFIAYGVDKRRANLQKRRIPEKQLHLMEILGGWPGAVLGQQVFRHKTIKMSFRLVLWCIVGLHVALSGYFVYDAFRNKQIREQILEDAQASRPRAMVPEVVQSAGAGFACRFALPDAFSHSAPNLFSQA